MEEGKKAGGRKGTGEIRRKMKGGKKGRRQEKKYEASFLTSATPAFGVIATKGTIYLHYGSLPLTLFFYTDGQMNCSPRPRVVPGGGSRRVKDFTDVTSKI